MRSSLFAIALILSAPAFAQSTPAGDVPSKDAKPDAKADKDVVKASVDEDTQPVRRSIPLRGGTLAYTVTPGHLTIRNDEGEPTASMFARLNQEQGPVLIAANNGRYNLDTQQVAIDGPVKVAGGDGFRLMTSNVIVDLKGRQLATRGPAEGATRLGQFRASRVRADLGSHTVVMRDGRPAPTDTFVGLL